MFNTITAAVQQLPSAAFPHVAHLRTQRAFSSSRGGAGRGEPMENGPGYSWTNRQCDDSRCRLSSFSQPPRDLCVDTYVQNMSKGCQLLSASSQCALLECLKINTPRNLRSKIRGLTTERSFFSLPFSSPDWRVAKVTGRLVAVSDCTGQMGQSAACMSG